MLSSYSGDLLIALFFAWNYVVRLARARAIAATICYGAVPPMWLRLASEPFQRQHLIHVFAGAREELL